MIQHGIPLSSFSLLPIMMSSEEVHIDMNSSDLSNILETSLRTVRRRHDEKCSCTDQCHPGYVIFLGMDSPEINVNELIGINEHHNSNHHSCINEAFILPTADGGYGVLAIPPCADPKKTFRGVRWSDPLTAISQIKAFTDQNISVIMGQLMYDIDEPDDVMRLCDRLQQENDDSIKDNPRVDNLSTSSSWVHHRPQNLTACNDTNSLQYTQQALRHLNLMK
jgi:hypothetical protein